ncbi:MAG: Ig-like domain-containing protein, partial [Bacillota bacterium]
MKRIKPKWLLGATLVAAIVMSCSLMVQAAAPSFTGSGITSPTGASPAYRQAGATFTTTFTYASDPDTIPRWTKALVQLYDGDTLVKEIEETIPSARLDGGGADPSYTGTASIGMIIPPPPLPGLDEGLYDVKVFLSNSDGGGWSVSDTELGAVIIDETPPSAPGAPSTTTPTTDTTPDWTWTAATDPTILGGATPGSGVKGYWVRIGTTSGDDDVLTDTWVGNVLNWTTSLALTPDDTYYLSVCAEDNVGNLGDWATGSVLVDTTNPLAPTGLTATTPTNDTTPEVSWTAATDPGYPDSGSGIAGYNVQIGTSSGGSDVKVATWVGDITTFDDAAWAALGVTLAPDGTYYFQVQSVDNVGWTSGWAEVAIVVDTARPVLANGLPNVYGTDDTPTISADFTDVGVGLDASETTLTLTYDGTPTVITTGFTGVPGYADGLPATNIQYTPGSSLADGAYTVDMVAYDLAGNKTTPDPTLQWTFNIDTTPPTDPGSPTAGNLGDDGKWYINTLRPTFSWTASEDPDAPDGSPGSGLHHYWFQFGTEASKPGTGTDAWASATVEEPSVLATLGVTVQQWTPSTDLPLAADVDYSARVKAFDVLGNASSWVDPLIVYDPDPPTTPGAPVPEDDPTNDATPLWSWEGSTDDISGVDLYHIQIRRAGSADWDVLDTFLDIPDALAPGDEEWEQGLPLESGDYEIRVRAMDVAGNYSDWSEPGTVTVDVDPPAVPDMPQTASPTNDTTPTWTWDAVADADHYEVYLDGVHMTDDAVETDTEYTPTVALGEGQHYLQVSAVDALGNESALSEAGYVVIDTTDPQAPEMTALPEYTNADEIVFTWSAVTDAVSYDFRYSLDGGVVWTPVLGLTVPTYTVDISGAVDGAEILGSVIAYDEAGNDSPESDPASTIVDRTGPVVNAVSPLAPVTTNDPTPAWEWSGDDGTGCGVKGYWVTLDDEAAIWTTATSFTPAAALVDGDHILKVVGVDELDNEGTETVFATVSIDTTPPAIPGMPWTTSPTNNTTPHWYWTQVSGATRYNVYLDNVLMVTVLQPGDPGALVDWITAPALSEGEHYLQVSSLDELGNESALSEAGYVTIDTTGPVAPVVTLVTPSPTNEEQTWSWTRPADAVRYDFGESADGITPPAVFTDVGNVDTYKTDFAPDGTHYVMVRGYDALGNVGAWSAAASVVIDTTPPGVPTDLAVVSPTTDKTPTWGWSAMAGAAGYEIRLDGAIIEDVADAIVYTHSEELGDGSHTLEVRSYDDLGNKSAWCAPVTVVVDTA